MVEKKKTIRAGGGVEKKQLFVWYIVPWERNINSVDKLSRKTLPPSYCHGCFCQFCFYPKNPNGQDTFFSDSNDLNHLIGKKNAIVNKIYLYIFLSIIPSNKFFLLHHELEDRLAWLALWDVHRLLSEINKNRRFMWENYAFSVVLQNIINACASKMSVWYFSECCCYFFIYFQLFFYCFGSRSAMCRSERNKIFGTLASGHNSEIQYKSPRQYCIIKRNLCRHSNFSHYHQWLLLLLGGLSFSNIYIYLRP